MKQIQRYYCGDLAIICTVIRETVSSRDFRGTYTAYTSAMVIGQLALETLEKQGLTLHPMSTPQGEGRGMCALDGYTPTRLDHGWWWVRWFKWLARPTLYTSIRLFPSERGGPQADANAPLGSSKRRWPRTLALAVDHAKCIPACSGWSCPFRVASHRVQPSCRAT